MAGKKPAKIATRGKAEDQATGPQGEFVTVLKNDVRRSMYLNPQGLPFEQAKNAAETPWDWRRNRPLPGVEPRVVISLTEYQRYQESPDPVAYSQVEKDRKESGENPLDA